MAEQRRVSGISFPMDATTTHSYGSLDGPGGGDESAARSGSTEVTATAKLAKDTQSRQQATSRVVDK